MALELQVADLATRVKAARLGFDLTQAAPDVRRLSRLAQLLEREDGFEAVAAIYYDAIVSRFGALEAAPTEGSAQADVVRRIQEAHERRDALLSRPEIRAAYAVVPGH